MRHCLLARRGTTLRDVRRVVAHPQALAQCRHWLATHLPGVPTVEEASNARAAERAARGARHGGDRGRGGGERYGLAVLARGIQDEPGNVTRFLVLGAARRERAERRRQDLARRARVRDEVGVLAQHAAAVRARTAST